MSDRVRQALGSPRKLWESTSSEDLELHLFAYLAIFYYFYFIPCTFPFHPLFIYMYFFLFFLFIPFPNSLFVCILLSAAFCQLPRSSVDKWTRI